MPLLEFILALSTLLLLHELGHFLACRLFKIEVEEFGLGFPPRLLTLFTHKGTKFTLNALPFGGFVRPKGDNDPSIPGGLASARPGVRLAMLLAGPLMNLLAAVLIFAISFSAFGIPTLVEGRVQVTAVESGSPAELGGLQACDMILAVNDEPMLSPDNLREAIYANLGQPVLLSYQRGDGEFEITVTPRRDPPEGQGALGVEITYPLTFEPASWSEVLSLSAASTGLRIYSLASLPVQLIQGTLSPEEGRVVGPKGIYDIYSAVREGDVMACTPRGLNILDLFASITISLGVLNLLPLPALDGGRIIFVLFEIITRRRIPPEYENWVNAVGFMLLIAYLLYITLQDFIHPFTP